MPRKCTVCGHKDKAEINRKIVANEGSALTIARLFDLSKDSILRHRSHIEVAIKSAQTARAAGFEQLVEQVRLLTQRMERHLSNSQRSELWFKESRELRNWIALRTRLAGKIVTDEGKAVRVGDVFYIRLVAPDGTEARVSLDAFRSLPPEVFSKESPQRGDNSADEVAEDQ